MKLSVIWNIPDARSFALCELDRQEVDDAKRLSLGCTHRMNFWIQSAFISLSQTAILEPSQIACLGPTLVHELLQCRDDCAKHRRSLPSTRFPSMESSCPSYSACSQSWNRIWNFCILEVTRTGPCIYLADDMLTILYRVREQDRVNNLNEVHICDDCFMEFRQHLEKSGIFSAEHYIVNTMIARIYSRAGIYDVEDGDSDEVCMC